MNGINFLFALSICHRFPISSFTISSVPSTLVKSTTFGVVSICGSLADVLNTLIISSPNGVPNFSPVAVLWVYASLGKIVSFTLFISSAFIGSAYILPSSPLTILTLPPFTSWIPFATSFNANIAGIPSIGEGVSADAVRVALEKSGFLLWTPLSPAFFKVTVGFAFLPNTLSGFSSLSFAPSGIREDSGDLAYLATCLFISVTAGSSLYLFSASISSLVGFSTILTSTSLPSIIVLVLPSVFIIPAKASSSASDILFTSSSVYFLASSSFFTSSATKALYL